MQILLNIPDEQISKSLEESKYIHEDEGEKGSVEIDLLYTNKNLDFIDIVRKKDFYSLRNQYKIFPNGCEIKPVIHSYWIERTEPIGEDDVDTFVMCVNCRNTFDNVSTYCPCCGALMDGRSNPNEQK